MRYLGFGIAAFTLACAVIVSALASTVTQTQARTIPAVQPHWTPIHAKQFPGCVGTGSFVPARIVVVAREGEARTMRYSEATIAKINATWSNSNAWDDLYTIGKCAR